MCILSYEILREFSDTQEDELFEFKLSDHDFQLILMAGLIVAGFICMPENVHAIEKVLEKSDDFFYVEGQKYRKLFSSYDFRPSSQKVVKKVIKKAIKKSEKLLENSIDLNLNLAPIDLTGVFVKNKEVITLPSTYSPVSTSSLGVGNSISPKVLLLRGGMAGFLLGKLTNRLGKRAEEWISNKLDSKSEEKQKESGLNHLGKFFTANPIVMMAFVCWAIISGRKDSFKKVVQTTMPKKVVDILVGEKRDFKYYALKAISWREPYLYCFLAVCFVVAYRTVLQKLLRREITTGEVISEITTGFLKANSELFGKLYSLSQDFTSTLLKVERRSFDRGEEIAKEKSKLLENNIIECKNEKSRMTEELKNLYSNFNTCSTTYNLLNSQVENLIDQLSQVEALKALEFEIKEALPPGDERLLLGTSELIERMNYQGRLTALYHATRDRISTSLKEKLVLKSFEPEKKNNK
jgi:hypothetical protein